MTSNVDPTPATPTPVDTSATKLATDAVAAVIDESWRRGESSITLDDLTHRLSMQFHNLPGFDEANFRARANASAKIADLGGGDRGTAKLDAAARKAEDKHKKAS